MNSLKKLLTKTNNKIIILSLLCVLVLSLILTQTYSYFYTRGNIESQTVNVIIPNFAPKVNNDYNVNQSINLANTITNNKSLSPGAEGRFKVDIDFTNVGYDTYYTIYYERTNLPNNIHFYVDHNYTTELIESAGNMSPSSSNKIVEYYVYWKWIVDDSADSNANDSLYMDQNIEVTFKTHVSQYIEEYTFYSGGRSTPTGRVTLSSNSSYGRYWGEASLSYNFHGTGYGEYRVYFATEDYSSDNLQLYNDALDTSCLRDDICPTEVDYITINYTNPTSYYGNKKIYWRTTRDTHYSKLYYHIVKM